MRPRRRGKGVLAPLWKCCKVFLCIASYSKTLNRGTIYALFSPLVFGFWELCPQTPTGASFLDSAEGLSSETPNLPTLGKNPAGTRGVCARLSAQNLQIDLT